jgi:hypothetical protein
LEEDEIELIDEDNDTEEELHVAIAELMGSLFKTHKELTLPLVDLLYNQILSKVLDPALSDKMHKFGLFLIDDMIEYLGIELIQDKWGALSEVHFYISRYSRISIFQNFKSDHFSLLYIGPNQICH